MYLVPLSLFQRYVLLLPLVFYGGPVYPQELFSLPLLIEEEAHPLLSTF